MLTRASTIFLRRTLLRTNTISQEITTHRCIHLVSQIKKTPRNISLLNLHKNYRIIGVPLVRYASTDDTPISPSPENNPNDEILTSPLLENNPYNEIPDPPIPTPIEEIVENIVKLHPNGEQTFASIGLNGYTPVGFVEWLMEFMHINCDIPWWTAIVIGTLCVRILIFPLVIMSQKNMVKLTNHMPTIKKLQMEMTEARQSGDHYESARLGTELMQFMKKNQISGVKNFIVPLFQAPMFLSFFLALRAMANTPVESLKHGGFWWLQDLTTYDPYYIMPIVTCVTMYITIEVGADGTNIKTMGLLRYVIRAVPFVILPFMVHFPGAILVYWGSTNFISLMQTGLLKVPRIRKALDMPVLIKHPTAVTKSDKGFREELRESWTNMKISRQLAERERVDAIQFNRAGRGPLVRTFKYDPTKQKQSTILTKNR